MDSTIADMYYVQLPTGGPTQGDVWAGLPAANVTDDPCCGLVITPRCDFAHSKAPVLNYLPIVSLEKYLCSTVCFPHLEHLAGDIRDGLRSKVAALNIDHLFDLDIPLQEIRAEISQLETNTISANAKQIDRAKLEFEVAYQKLQEFASLQNRSELSKAELIGAFNKRKLFSIQRDLIKNNSVDTYFLPPCSPLLNSPSLVLLRHIYTCPIHVVDPARTEQGSVGPVPERLLRLASPFIESLMAKFAALFTTVGTRDIPDAAVKAYILPDGMDPK